MAEATSTASSLFQGGRISVNVRLCGSIPRKDMVVAEGSCEAGGAPSLRGPVSRESLNGLVFASTNGPAPTLTKIAATAGATPTNPPREHHDHQQQRLVSSSDNPRTTFANHNTAAMARGILTDRHQHQVFDLTNHHQQQQAAAGCISGVVLEPPVWAVPASGESRLEPVCDSIGRQTAVDLTTRACFRIGRSPNSDVQLLHATSSRRHALLFHHENGSCYVVDCGSAHGTYVNGVRISSPSAAVAASGNCANGGGAATNGMVVPHKVKRGALIRFGGPGAPSFLLKSFNFKLEEIDRMVVSPPLSISSHATSTTTAATASRPAVVASSEPDKGELVRRNTRINALGRTAASKVRDALFLTIDVALSVTRKRSFDSLDSRDTLDTAPSLEENDEPIGNGKRLRCSSPPPSPEEPPLRLVSPDLPQTVVRCVDGADCHHHHHHRSKRVSFSAEPPTLFYPASVTPDEPLAVECGGTTLRCGGGDNEEPSYPHCVSS